MINYQRQAIARNIGALKGIEAFVEGDMVCTCWWFHDCSGQVTYVGSGSVQFLDEEIPPEDCYYPRDESLWSERQRQMVDSLCKAVEMVRA